MRGGEVPSCDVGARIGYAYRTTALGAQRVHEKGLEVKNGVAGAPPLTLTLLGTHSMLRGKSAHPGVAAGRRAPSSGDGSGMKGADDR